MDAQHYTEQYQQQGAAQRVKGRVHDPGSLLDDVLLLDLGRVLTAVSSLIAALKRRSDGRRFLPDGRTEEAVTKLYYFL